MSWTENKTVRILRPKNQNSLSEAIDFMIEHVTDESFDSLRRAIKIMEGASTNISNPFPDWWMKEGERLINRDWICLEINSLGMRL